MKAIKIVHSIPEWVYGRKPVLMFMLKVYVAHGMINAMRKK